MLSPVLGRVRSDVIHSGWIRMLSPVVRRVRSNVPVRFESDKCVCFWRTAMPPSDLKGHKLEMWSPLSSEAADSPCRNGGQCPGTEVGRSKGGVEKEGSPSAALDRADEETETKPAQMWGQHQHSRRRLGKRSGRDKHFKSASTRSGCDKKRDAKSPTNTSTMFIWPSKSSKTGMHPAAQKPDGGDLCLSKSRKQKWRLMQRHKR